MTEKLSKMAVLNALAHKDGTLSSSQLSVLLNHRVPERTLRRWLSELVSDGLVEKKGKKSATSYRAIKPDLLYAPGSRFSEISMPFISAVEQPLFAREPASYNFGWLESYEPNKTSYLPGKWKEKLMAEGQRTGSDELAGTYARHILNRLLVDLSYNSSRLEGNTYSLLDTEKLLLEGISAKGKLDEEKIMILNHKDAIRYLIDNAEDVALTKNKIFTLHYLLSDGLISQNLSGRIRDHGVRISGSVYIPLENSKKIEKALDIICEKSSMIKNPHEQSLFLLSHIAYLQAFSDVNKRTSRLSANIPLIKNNLSPLSFNDVNKKDYHSAIIALYELNEIKPLTELFIYSYSRSCKIYNATIESTNIDGIRVRYRNERRSLIRKVH